MLLLKDSTAIKVRMASFTVGDDYDFYQLDEFSGDWGTNKGTARARSKIQKEKKSNAKSVD